MTVSFHKYGDMFFPGTGDVKVLPQPFMLHIFFLSTFPSGKCGNTLVYRLLSVNFVKWMFHLSYGINLWIFLHI